MFIFIPFFDFICSDSSVLFQDIFFTKASANYSMSSENENLEERLKSLIAQLQSELAILDKIVHKGKNQHRRSLYFQYLLKVRRDVRLLQSACLEEILNFVFQVINNKKPSKNVHILESLKRRKCPSEKHNFQERLLGVARLLSQMVEPMVKAAIEISTLLARSFFMGFSLTILALLARFRVLVQQMLLDVVSVFNILSSLSQKGQSIKLYIQGAEAFREYYPSDNVLTLECVWVTDKFVLLEKFNKIETKNHGEHFGGGKETLLQPSNIKYQTIEAVLGDDEPDCQKMDADYSEEFTGPTEDRKHATDASAEINNGIEVGDNNEDERSREKSSEKNSAEGSIIASTSPIPQSTQTESRNKVAFLSVGKSTPSKMKESGLPKKSYLARTASEKDPFSSLLNGGDTKDTLF